MSFASDMEHKVCVTGASGFLASWLIKRLLSSGYHVTGTVRDLGFSLTFSSIFQKNVHKHLCILFVYGGGIHAGKQKKYEYLWSLEGATERLQLVQADLMEEGSFDNAIMGCKGVFHVASPVLSIISDPKVYIYIMVYVTYIEHGSKNIGF